MVAGVSQNSGVGHMQGLPITENKTVPRQKLPSNAEVDEFVSYLEAEHKKARMKKNVIGGTVTAASLLALLGGTLMKSKWGRALSIAPIALTTLTFGALSLIKGNKTPDFRAVFENVRNVATAEAHQA